ncbi:MAG: hypothetical protein GY749_16525 [Desulfobacteraceae bacterium]|nr:hypothetical protein [Desulfobacteraceae bacterium]
MFPIKNIREYITNKLDEITVLRKFRDNTGILTVAETADSNDEDRKQHGDKELLNKVEIRSVPIDNVWVFENEFSQQPNIADRLINDQRGAFTSAGRNYPYNDTYRVKLMISGGCKYRLFCSNPMISNSYLLSVVVGLLYIISPTDYIFS